jgi:hypothetical protein
MTDTSSLPKKPNRYRYAVHRGTDGCDDTYEVNSADNHNQIAWVGFWKDKPAYRRQVRKVAAFLETVANEDLRLDLGALIEEFKAIGARWGGNELREARPDLPEGDIWHVLSYYRNSGPLDEGLAFPDDLIAIAARIFPPSATQ